jgi:hypothetical protein
VGQQGITEGVAANEARIAWYEAQIFVFWRQFPQGFGLKGQLLGHRG